jgi:DNA-binding transcriptional MerR regulator
VQLSDNSTNEDTLFAIGTVARLTGVGKDTIRAWERRYRAIEPHRTPTGGRLYSRDDIARLALLKRLIDGGERAGLLCRLSTKELHARLELHAQHAAKTRLTPVAAPPRVVIVGGALAARLAHDEAALPGVELIGLYHQPERLTGMAPFPADVLVLEFPTVDETSTAELKRLLSVCAAAHTLIVYGFGTRRAVDALDTDASTPVRAPVGLTELRKLILASARPIPPHPAAGSQASSEGGLNAGSIPSRRFDDAALASLAASATPLDCECPHHLVDLIRSLLAFERYSGDCESRNDADAAVHRLVHEVTAQARASLESGLEEVAKHESLLPKINECTART